MPKVIQTSETPNPNALKFHMDTQVLLQGSRSFADKESAQKDPAAKALFELPQVTSVFYINDVVTVNKGPESVWNELIPPIADILEEHLKVQIGSESTSQGTTASIDVESFEKLSLDEKLQQINGILDETVRPGLAGDGGGVEVLELDGSLLKVHYEGACGSCPSASEGTLQYIEQTLRQRVHPSLQVLAT
jgi:Fe-S cluster biogenesis protein NfuA